MERKMLAKERDTGPRGGDRQPAHEGGREGSGTRRGGRDTGKKGGKGGKGGKGSKGGKKSQIPEA